MKIVMVNRVLFSSCLHQVVLFRCLGHLRLLKGLLVQNCYSEGWCKGETALLQPALLGSSSGLLHLGSETGGREQGRAGAGTSPARVQSHSTQTRRAEQVITDLFN